MIEIKEFLADIERYIELARDGLAKNTERQALMRLLHWFMLERKWLQDDRPHLKLFDA